MATQTVIHPSALLISDQRLPALVWADDPSLPTSQEARYTCLQGHPMKLRRGKVLQWHFSHIAAEINCNGEGDLHRALKYGLARQLEQTLGSRATVWPEYRWNKGALQQERIPDIMVATWDTSGRITWVTIEVQHSPIDIDTLQRRVHYDVRHRWCPAWVFTSQLIHLPQEVHHGMRIEELRVPNAAAWLMNCWGVGLTVVDLNTGRLWHLMKIEQSDRNKKSQDAKYFDVQVSSMTSHLVVVPKRRVYGSHQRYRVATWLPRVLPSRMDACAKAGTLVRLPPNTTSRVASQTA